MQFYQEEDKGRAYGARKFWQEAINDPGAQQMQYLRKLMLAMPYFERIPGSQEGERYNRIITTIGKSRDYLLAYNYTGRVMNMKMGQINSKTVQASWYNPRNGQYSIIGIVNNSGTQRFDPPGEEKEGNDWVLVLEKYAANGTAYLFTSFHEPASEGLRLLYSYDGYKWSDLDTVLLHPDIGNQKVMRDPSMVQGPDGTFHLVWTSSWRGDKGFGYSSSKDMVHWTSQQFIPVMQHESTTVNVWAPELFYDKDSKQFLIIWASTIPGRFDRGIEEDSNNHRMYITTTKDFKVFTPATLFLDPGFSVIDAVIVRRKPSDYVLVLKDNTRPNRNIKIAYADRAEGPYQNVSAPFTGSFTEGPSVLHKGDSWLIYYDAYRKGTYDAMRTKDFKNFTDISSEVMLPKGHKHGTIVEVDQKVLEQLLRQTGKTK